MENNELNNKGAAPATEPENKPNAETPEEGAKTYTEEEVKLMLQKEGDKRITQYQKTMERKQRESEKLRNMNEEDKKIYELNQRELAIEEKEKALAILENKQEGLSILLDKGLDVGLIDYVINEDAEVMYESINKMDKLFKKSVKAEVERRLGSSAPKKASVEPETLTLEKLKKITDVNELAQVKADNPELWEQLKGSLN